MEISQSHQQGYVLLLLLLLLLYENELSGEKSLVI
jgi:hypothetical protein